MLLLLLAGASAPTGGSHIVRHIALSGRRASPSFEGRKPDYELQGRKPSPSFEGRVGDE